MKLLIRVRDEHGLQLTVMTDSAHIEIWEMDDEGVILLRKRKLPEIQKAKPAAAAR